MSIWPIRVMVYAAGAAINGANELNGYIHAQLSKLGQVATNQYVAAVAQLNSSAASSFRCVLDPLGRQLITRLPDFNAGDPQQLINFVQWGAAICPANQAVLVLSGHGAAWQDELERQVLQSDGFISPLRSLVGRPRVLHHARSVFRLPVTSKIPNTRALLMDGTDHDYLSNAELGAACERIASNLGGPIDVLVFDACLMSSFEILAELSSAVRTVVASLDELSAEGVDMSSPIATITAVEGQTNAKKIAETIVTHFEPKASFDACVAIDLSSPEWATAIRSFRSCCNELDSWIQKAPANRGALRDALQRAANSVVKFWSGGLADVSALVSAITEISNIPAACIRALNSLESNLRSCVIEKSLGTDYRNALGLSIFAPESVSDYMKNRPDYVRLRFSKETGWSEILDRIFEASTIAPQFTSPRLPMKIPVARKGIDRAKQPSTGRSSIPLKTKRGHAKRKESVRIVKSNFKIISGADD